MGKARPPKRKPQQQPILEEQKQVMGLVMVVSAGGKPRDVVEFAAENRIGVNTIRATAEGLAENAMILRQACELLQPPADEEEG